MLVCIILINIVNISSIFFCFNIQYFFNTASFFELQALFDDYLTYMYELFGVQDDEQVDDQMEQDDDAQMQVVLHEVIIDYSLVAINFKILKAVIVYYIIIRDNKQI